MTTPRLTAFIASALVFALATGCSEKDANASQAGNDTPANVVLKTPPIHLRQTGVTMNNGKPHVETEYKYLLYNCQKAHGKLTLTPIRGNRVDKLGRTYYDIWFKGDQVAIRSTSWGFKVQHLCEFHAVRHVRMAIANADGVYSINLDDGTAIHDASSTVVRNAIRPQTAGQKAADAKERAKVVAALKKQGYAAAVDTAPSNPTSTKVVGQPCTQTSSPTYGQSCIWTGGVRWGFRQSGPATVTAGYISGFDPLLTDVDVVKLPGDTILLSHTPPDDGVGDRLTTQTMTVGKPFDAHVFEVAPNISVQPTGQ